MWWMTIVSGFDSGEEPVGLAVDRDTRCIEHDRFGSDHDSNRESPSYSVVNRQPTPFVASIFKKYYSILK